MPNENEDMAFTFDTSFFEKGLKVIADKLTILEKKSNALSEKMKSAFDKVENKIKNFNSLITTPFKKIKNIFLSPFEALKYGVNKLKPIADKIISPFNFIGKKIKDIFNKSKEHTGGLGTKVGDISKGVIKGMTNMIGKVGLFGLALKGINIILNNMPEIGQAFGIAKDVFLKNLLFPLRKMLFPYLQKMLDWVRDNRLQFIKWGQVLANVFKVVASSIKFIIDMGKKILSAFSGFFEKTFGVSTKNITDMFNVLSFKFAVVMTFLQSIISKLLDRFKPVFETLGDLFAGLIKDISNFVEGFISGLKDIDKQFGIIEEINSLFKEMKYYLEVMEPLFKPLGKALGKVFGITLLTALRTVESVLIAITDLIGLITKKTTSKKFLEDIKTKGLGKFFTGNKENNNESTIVTNKNINKIIKNNTTQTILNKENNPIDKKIKNNIYSKNNSVEDAIINSTGKINKISPTKTIITKEINDAIITKNGEIIQTNPKDNLIATQNNISLKDIPKNDINNKNKIITLGGIKIDFSGMQIILQKGTKEEAINTGKNIVETIRKTLQQELEAIGDY